MPTSHVAKSPTTIPLPDGSYCALFNEVTTGYSAGYYTDPERTSLYTYLDMSTFSQQRCLQYQLYSDTFVYNPDSVLSVPFLSDTDTVSTEGSSVSQPIFECISPTATYHKDKGVANVLFWTNLQTGQSLTLNEKGQYVYDSTKILKIPGDKINDFSFEKGKITRLLCSVTISFQQLYVKGNVADNLKIAPKRLVPIATNLIVLKQVQTDSPVLDFSTGGGGGGSGGAAFSRHAHMNNSDCGFAFAVFHPGTGVPLGNPWKT